LLTSGVADSELMRSNTKLALRVGPDPEQEDLFDELYEDFIQAHQMDKFRMKRGQAVSIIRGAATKWYDLPATGTEDWSKITTELLAGKFFVNVPYIINVICCSLQALYWLYVRICFLNPIAREAQYSRLANFDTVTIRFLGC
jgi:hypothetical protein